MGCCNRAPKGGTNSLATLIKSTLVIGLVLFIIVALFG